MATTIKIVGVDPGFRSVGVALLERKDALLIPKTTFVIETKPSNKKERLAVTDDESQRLTEIETALLAYLKETQPHVLAIEDPPWGRNAKAVRVCALMWGAVHALAFSLGIPVLNLGAQQVKKHVAGKNTASKDDMYDALRLKFPKFNTYPTSKQREHAVDALGIAVTASEHELVRSLVKLSANT